jgi:hypothetical protein
MEGHDIERSLAELWAELETHKIKKPIRLLIIGGAYALIFEHASRTTEDIDIFWLEEDSFQNRRFADARS